MSDDIVDRLNITADMIGLGDKIRYGSDSQIMREAADEIEKLRAALKPFADDAQYTSEDDEAPFCVDTRDLLAARAAMEGKDD